MTLEKNTGFEKIGCNRTARIFNSKNWRGFDLNLINIKCRI
jgi:hypothetical protein